MVVSTQDAVHSTQHVGTQYVTKFMEIYQDLLVWQRSIELVTLIYTVTADFPDSEKFGLVNQMRRSAVSIPSNIAEGHARKSSGDFVRFLRISYGSSAELETQLIISKKLSLVGGAEFDRIQEQTTVVRKMLNKLITSLSV